MPELEGKVIAELSFGFWRYLVAKRYQPTAWSRCRGRSPYTRPDRARLTWTWTIECNAIHVLRNRIAHREPIFRRDLDHDHTDMLTLAGWISAEARGWIEGLSRVPDLLAQRPTG